MLDGIIDVMGKIAINLFSKKPASDRSCDNCTRCCEGWLTATIHGEEMYPGKPCQYVEVDVGCTIYNDRPKNPCKDFMCEWRLNDQIPLEFKPSLSNSIIFNGTIRGMPYYNIIQCGEEIDPEFLSWLVLWCMSANKNVRWEANNKSFWFGSQEFVYEMQKQDQLENSTV
jgi:hypothetical protein